MTEEYKPGRVMGLLPSGSLSVKRFYLAGVTLEYTCPKCAVRGVVRDLNAQYLSFPKFNEPFEVGLVCSACAHEWEGQLLLALSLHTVDTPPPGTFVAEPEETERMAKGLEEVGAMFRTVAMTMRGQIEDFTGRGYWQIAKGWLEECMKVKVITESQWEYFLKLEEEKGK